MPLLTGMAVLALLTGMAPAVAATGSQSAVAAKQAGATTAPSGSRCGVSYLQSGGLLPGATVTNATLVTSGSYTPPGQAPISGLPPFCDVTAVQDDPSGNPMTVEVWLPLHWNGKFEGIGGAGYLCPLPSFYSGHGAGDVVGTMQRGVQDGYATVGTDCGESDPTGGFALEPNGSLNTALIEDFAARGVHDASVDGQAITAAYYQRSATYRYFYGCSTGGREGLMEAQQYPADYNGIVSGAPAINWTKFIPSEIWPELVMLESHDFLPSCKEQAFTDAAIAACADGSGVIENPAACRWNPFRLVGEVTPCGRITATDAAVVEKIWDGPVVDGKHLWYGLEPGASFLGLAATTTASNGVTSPSPFPIPVTWLATWLQQNPGFNWQSLTSSEFVRLFDQSVSEYSQIIATDNPNLSAFEHDGGKILIWAGLADELIFPQGVIQYYQRVQDTLGVQNTATFARLFLAPGAQHCAAAAGPAPTSPLQDVVNWVEHGQAPTTVLATGGVAASKPTQRPLCMYPDLSEYVSGNPDSLNSYSCARLTPGQQQQLTALR